MKVHLIRAAGLDEGEFEQIFQILQAQPSPLSFQLYPQPVKRVPSSLKEVDGAWGEPEEGFGEDVLEPCASWEELFICCNDLRTRSNLADEDFLVFLTPQRNSLNWFSAYEEDKNNIFIHTDEWEEYLQCSSVFPVTYLVMAMVLQKILYNKLDFHLQFVHASPVGCFNDFCGDKRQVIFKLRTADICPKCLEYIKTTGTGVDLINQALTLFEAVRKEMLFRQRFNNDLLPGRLHISRTNQLLLPDYQKEIKLAPLQKVVYLLFLKHARGIVLKERDKYGDELIQMYKKLDKRTGREDTVEETMNRIKTTVAKLVDPLDNTLHENISAINRKIRRQLGEEMAKNYVIPNGKGEKKTIPLDRSLVSCDSGII